MKNTFFLFIAALFVTAAANAQSTVDSIRAKYQLLPMPEPLTIEKTYPVLGSYQLAAADGTTPVVTVTLDSTNYGTVWVEGLPEGKFKAYLKKSPGTYRVISQKSASGRQIPEGTLMIDTATRTLNIALGKKYDEADPAAVFALAGTDVSGDAVAEVKVKSKSGNSKTKTKVVFYSAMKMDTNTTLSTPAAPAGITEQQPQQQ